MFGFTITQRVTSAAGLNVTFRGFTLEHFQNRYIDVLKTKGDSVAKHRQYTQLWNNKLMDISERCVLRALIKSFLYAQDAATRAASYFHKRPGGLHRYADMAKIFRRHFKLDAPTDKDRDEVERVFRATSAGLDGALVISDLFAAEDGARDGGLVAGAEGQVAFRLEEDVLYAQELKTTVEQGGCSHDVTRKYLSQAQDAQIYIAFELIMSMNVAQLARVILHEATHKFAFTGDYAYHASTNDWNTLTSDKAIKNADSYAYGAISVKESSALSPEKIKRVAGPLLSMGELRQIRPSLRGGS